MTIVIIDRKIRRVMCTIYKNQTINKNILFNIDKQIWKCYINHKKIVSKIQYPKLHKENKEEKNEEESSINFINGCNVCHAFYGLQHTDRGTN